MFKRMNVHTFTCLNVDDIAEIGQQCCGAYMRYAAVQTALSLRKVLCSALLASW